MRWISNIPVLRWSFWFGRKRYFVVKADAVKIIAKELAELKPKFEYSFFTLTDNDSYRLLDEIELELEAFVPTVAGMAIRKQLQRHCGLLVIARNRVNDEIAACCVCGCNNAERNLLPIWCDESYVGNSYTRPKYRGMGLQGSTLQQGVTFLKNLGRLRPRVVAVVHPHNEASLRGLAKVGFEITGAVVEQRLFRFVRLIKGSCDGDERFVRFVFGNPI
jgi:ribosomal protein S18 acetylase RimI-like enzyme